MIPRLLGLLLLMVPIRAQSVEILDADPELTTSFKGRSKTEEQFGSSHFIRPQSYNHLLGSIYYQASQETVLVFGFRLSADFLREWKNQGTARVLFNVIKFHEGDAGRICPIHIMRLAQAASSAEAASQPPLGEIGVIRKEELKESQIYSYSLNFQEDLQPGDIVWIGLDATNPIDVQNHNLIIAGDLNAHPGGSPPMMITGSPDATTRTVHGMSLLQSLNRLFYAPENLDEVSTRTPMVPRWINPLRTADSLDTLEVFHQTLHQELAKLPDNPIFIPDQYKGFHSSVKPLNEGWELRFPVTRRVTSIALYPAVQLNGKQVESYAFPRRFTITAVPRGNDDPVVVADWSQSDFPRKGIAPVIFPFAWKFYDEVILTVQKGVPVPGGHAFALSEVSFPRRYSTWPIFMTAPPGDTVESPPYWSVNYVTDGRTAFGTPIATDHASEGTFRTTLKDGDSVQLILRSEGPMLWNSFEFHPTPHPDGLPPQGFPGEFMVEFSNSEDFSDIQEVIRSPEMIPPADALHPFTLRFPRIGTRCARITLFPTDVPDRQPFIQLEEITFNGGLPLLMNGWYLENQTISGSPGTEALYDRIINGNLWDPPVRRSVGLIRREILIDELQRVETTMKAITQADRNTRAWLKAGAVILAATLSGLVIIHQRRQSGIAQRRIRHRIQQDLHDEIGSQLSTISMITNFNRNIPDLPEEIRTEMTDANQCAREAIASLAEVIWLTDKEILTLDQCFDVMRKRAEKMVHSIKLETDFPEKVPAVQLSYRTKRNLILLFTEALNNALKHSGADTVRIHASLSSHRVLTLTVSDNGDGFSPDATDVGIGLESMNERAQKLGGKLDISSTPEHGTAVTFKGKL
ncbi:MAG: hypothetical protein JXR25_00260 [Pontiellaceae bacterium]|nr:hypothetical protein [Pontiellaceae bacterium]